MREIKTKIIASISLLCLLILSFFFAKPLEKAFGLNYAYAKNEVHLSAINSSAFEITFIDVGQGNSCFVRFPDKRTLLIDGGTTQYGSKIIDFLNNRNVEQIDYMIASHADSDHIGGLISVLENFEVKNIYRPFQIAGTGETTETFETNDYEDLAVIYEELIVSTANRSKISRVTSTDYNRLIELIYTETYTENQVQNPSLVTVFYDGLKIVGKDYSIEFFAPLVRETGVSIEEKSSSTVGEITLGYGTDASNDNSAIFLIDVMNNKFLFTGDATWRDNKNLNTPDKFEETDFLLSLDENDKNKLKNIDVLLAGHHGSSYSTSTELFSLTSPRFLVVSVGEGNPHGHPSSEVVFRAESTKRVESDYLLRTDKNGTISFVEVDNELKYVVETSNVISGLQMSWFEFSAINFIVLLTLIVFIRPIRLRQG